VKKICGCCKEEKDISQYYKRSDGSGDGYHINCKACKKKIDQQRKDITNTQRRERYKSDETYKEDMKVRAREYRSSNRKKINEHYKEYRAKRRILLLEKYGGLCACCKESQQEFLCIDHVFGGGNQERKTSNFEAIITKLLASEEISPDYQILCHNCNLAKGFYGYCPHQKIL
jgi:hypothetical protein